jgi:hypothetical protein
MRIVELIENFSSRDCQSVYRDGKNQRIGILCEKPAESFHGESSKLEYSISEIYQHRLDIFSGKCAGIGSAPAGSD